MVILTALGEAQFEPLDGQLAVIATIFNRQKDNPYGWKTLTDVVRANGQSGKKRIFQFEPWQRRKKELLGWPTKDADCYYDDVCLGKLKTYRRLAYLFDGFVSGILPDPTKALCKGKGAWYFLNRKIVLKRYRHLPPFAKGKSLRIGRHRFYCKK